MPSKKDRRQYWIDRRARLKAEKLAAHPALMAHADAVGIPVENVSSYWHKSKHFSVNVKADPKKTYFEIRDEIVRSLDKFSPRYPRIRYKKQSDSHLFVVDPADIHIGKMSSSFETGEDYNSQIAVKRVKEGVEGLISKASGWKFDETLLIIGNDILHVDGPTNATTSGTRQDVCDIWYNNFLIGKQLYIDTIERLVQVSPLRIQYNPSNHDYMSGFFLADSIKSHFRHNKFISFDVDLSHTKFHKYGKNLIGTTHGDGAKEQDLALLMAHRAAEFWAVCSHRYWYKHHLHHKASKDYMSVCVETLRSPSSADSWHHRNGYQHAPKAVEAFIHHPEHGQIARLTHLF